MLRFLTIWCAALVLAACGDDTSMDLRSADGGVAGSAGSAGATAELDCTATVSLLDYKLSPSKLELSAGHNVLCARNDGQAPHDIALRDASREYGRTPKLGPGTSAKLILELEPGDYTMFCTQAGHESLGMSGPVTVE